MVLTFESANKLLRCGSDSEGSSGAPSYVVQDGSIIRSLQEIRLG